MSSDASIDTAALDAFLEHKRRALRLPGLAVAVVSDGRIAYLCGLGAAAPGRAMTPQTPLVIGSLSKSITALAVMQLVEAGKLALDVPVQQYIPWFRLADAAASYITVRHLLTHTSGISRYAGRALLAGRGGKSIEQSVRDLCGLRLTQSVGTTFQYSNTNYLIAGLVVEAVSGQPFGAYIQQHILSPLNMQQSYVSEGDALRGGLASGYRWWFGLPVPFNAPYLDNALPAAFVAASAEDLARYLIALLDGGSPVLSPAGVASLFQPQASAAAGSSYGLGWRVESLSGVPIVRHGGEVSNFLSEVVLVPGLRLGVVLLMNASNGLVPLAVKDAGRMGSDVARFLLGMSQPRRRLSFRGFYALLDAALAGLSVYQVWSLARLLRSGPGSTRRVRWALGLAALVEVALAAVGLRAIPRLVDAPWGLLRLYVPDVTAWLALFSCGSLVKLLALLGRLLRSRS
jgi:CubicO group peptidase (beta-lactamase class C family)